MIILFTLLLAHLIADFPLQTNWIFALKLKSNKGIAFHVLIHLVVTALLIQEPLTQAKLFIILGTTHFLIDWLKLRFPTERQVPGFLLDQVLHLTAIGFLAAVSPTVQPVLPTGAVTLAMLYAFIPPIIMFLWLLTIDEGRLKEHTSRLINWGQRNLLVLSQGAGLPLLIGVGLGILFL
ncbi:MAG: DUF3307 domain-containing protein [Candidatus Promineifilaceae bacterium]